MGQFHATIVVRTTNAGAVEAISDLAARLSSGDLLDHYDRRRGYFDADSEESPPVGGDAERLAAAFDHSGRAGELETVLRRPAFDDDAYDFASDRHRDLARLLGIPYDLVSLSFEDVSEGRLPEGRAADGPYLLNFTYSSGTAI